MGVRKIRMVTHSGVWMMMMMACLEDVILAGPARGSGRMIREVYPEIEPEKLEGNQAEVCIVGDVVYGAEESVPADQPCLRCKCQPPGVRCETTECLKKPGCRAIHKSNKCCPEYQCECEYEGRLYANGERLETSPGGECKVCYCRGGEVQCAEVSCYIRTDCEGRAVPGQCCPKYDHCPPREPLIDRAPPYTPEPPSTLEYWSVLNTSLDGDQQPTPGYDIEDISNKITDAKEEEFHVPKITIQEIIPEIKEIPITGPPKREITFKHAHVENDSRLTNNVEDLEKETSKENSNISDLSTGDAEVESSEISEVFHHPPPVLKIGDRLLFLKQGELVPGKDSSTPLPVITIIGAEGLQRGTEDSGEYREIPSQVQHPSNEYMPVSEDPARDDPTTEITHIISFVRAKNKIEDTTGSSLSTIQDFLLNLTRNGLEATDSQEGVSDGSTSILTEEIVNKIKSLTNAESTTDVSHLIQRIFIADINDTDSETTTFNYSDQNITAGSEVENNTTEMRYEDLGESKIDQNPEYPPIPDIMSPQNLDELSEHSDSESGVSDKTSYTTTNGTFENGSHPLINPKAALPERLLIGLAPSDNNTEDIDNSTLTERSIETVESMLDESGEATTPKNRQASIISSSEDASVETVRPSAGKAQKVDVKDLVETISGYDVTTEPIRFNGTARPADVETIENPENSKPQLTKKTESELIFEQLNEELKSVPARTFYIGSSGGEEAEAEAIFKELLADTSTGSPSNAQDGKETELMERVSDAISKFQTKQQPKESLDVSILGLLRDFFGAQPKHQLKKEQ